VVKVCGDELLIAIGEMEWRMLRGVRGDDDEGEEKKAWRMYPNDMWLASKMHS
jgi:hypothetical protein